jgi:hypothetical protein
MVFWDVSPQNRTMNTEAATSSKTLVPIGQTTIYHSLEYRTLNSQFYHNLSSHIHVSFDVLTQMLLDIQVF